MAKVCDIRMANDYDIRAASAAVPPFDVRQEVSADAKHIARRIITHMWIIFVALPFVLALLYVVLTAK